MRTDELFYEYFQVAPQALFELLQVTPPCSYRFESMVVKASKRQLNGLLEPDVPEYPH
jgi:predicted transposase YdaD